MVLKNNLNTILDWYYVEDKDIKHRIEKTQTGVKSKDQCVNMHRT
jgi:hypothetical protein